MRGAVVLAVLLIAAAISIAALFPLYFGSDGTASASSDARALIRFSLPHLAVGAAVPVFLAMSALWVAAALLLFFPVLIAMRIIGKPLPEGIYSVITCVPRALDRTAASLCGRLLDQDR